jgi:hypothetical protein
MPYISVSEREKLVKPLVEIIEILENTEVTKMDGNLNYIITILLKRLYTPSYFNYNRAIGVLECVKQEYYRKVVIKYEIDKEKLNGDAI